MKRKLTLLAASITAALYLSACGTTHDHSSHDHDGHDHSSHDHSTSNAKPYPLDTCIVSDEKLGSMGKPIVMVHRGQQIKFCCKSCVDDFKAAPAKFLAKLNK